MKNQYVGDINDYHKYGVLRSLTLGGRLPSDVAWMLTPDDGRTDGSLKGYLSEPEMWRSYDPALFDVLASLVKRDRPDIRSIEESGILPGCRFYSPTVPVDRELRSKYLEGLADQSNDSALVFLDPDNGLEVPSIAYGNKGSEKYVFFSELETLRSLGRSLLVYQHFPRAKRRRYLCERFAQLGDSIGAEVIHALATPHVAFLLIPHPRHEEQLSVAVQYTRATWGRRLTWHSYQTSSTGAEYQ